MAKSKTVVVPITGELTLASGHFAIPAADVLALPGEPAPRGIVLLSERQDYAILTEDGQTVNVVASVYVQRSPMSDAERAAVKAAADDTQARKDKRTAEQQEAARAEKLAFARLAADILRDARR